MSYRQNRMIVAGMALSGADVTNAAVTVIEVVPAREASGLGAGLVEVGKALGRKLGPVLGGTKQRLGIGVVVADARPGVRGLDAQPVEHRQNRCSLERGTGAADDKRFHEAFWGFSCRKALTTSSIPMSLISMLGFCIMT